VPSRRRGRRRVGGVRRRKKEEEVCFRYVILYALHKAKK
jgi:hypothetical protein